MRRKLVFDDYLRLKKFFDELGITDECITFNLKERTVETEEDPSGENSKLSRRFDLRSEGEIIALLSARNEIPEPTGLRYLQYFRDYFDETAKGKIIYSSYNIKLLQTINQLISGGLSPEEVSIILKGGKSREGDSFVSSRIGPAKEAAWEYPDLTETRGAFPENKEKSRTGGRGKSVKWGLAVLLLLIAAAAGSYQLGYLERWALFFGIRTVADVPAGEEVPETGMAGDVEKEIAPEPADVGEIAEPEIPALLPAEITVEILNGSGVKGVAARFAEKLTPLGYQIIYVGNADRFDYDRSRIISRLEGDEAKDLLDVIPRAELLSEAPAQNEAMVTLILGKDYYE
jgi:hypothetical protein